MFDKLRDIICRADVDYGDIRYEIKKSSEISFSGKELTAIGSNIGDGFVIRVLKNGGMSSVTFTKDADAESANTKTTNDELSVRLNITSSLQSVNLVLP